MPQESEWSKAKKDVRDWLVARFNLEADATELSTHLTIEAKSYRFDVAVIRGGIVFLVWLDTLIKDEAKEAMPSIILTANWQIPYCAFEVSSSTSLILLKSYIVLDDEQGVSRSLLDKHLSWLKLALNEYPPIFDAAANMLIDKETAIAKIDALLPT